MASAAIESSRWRCRNPSLAIAQAVNDRSGDVNSEIFGIASAEIASSSSSTKTPNLANAVAVDAKCWGEKSEMLLIAAEAIEAIRLSS